MASPKTSSSPSAPSRPQPSLLAGGIPAVKVVGLESRPLQDLYHQILVRPWWQFVGFAAFWFILINALFAVLFWVAPGSIANARHGNFEDAFFFSVQSLATIGYGGMYPATTYGHLVVTFEALAGMLFVAVLTGVTFAKFSRPTARVAFSAKIAAPTRYGVPHLMFRMGNKRQNLVVEAQLRVLVLLSEETPEGEKLRRPVYLKLVRDGTALFTLTWTAMHLIDETSPFFGPEAMAKLKAQNAEIFLSFQGMDETFAQTIHARQRYALEDIAWNCKFADVLGFKEDGTRVVDYAHFDEVIPVQPTSPALVTGDGVATASAPRLSGS